MRLFIGIELPRSFRAEVSRIQRELKRRSAGGRFVPEDNFHITLRFIGESNAFAEAAGAMREAARGIRPFELHLGRYDSFEKGDSRTSILRVLGDGAELNALYESLQSALFDRGFSRDRKRFTPHITLGRSVSHTDEAYSELAALPVNASMQVGGITLFENARRDGRTIYSALHRERF